MTSGVQALSFFSQLLFPAYCFVCGDTKRIQRNLCHSCYKKINWIKPPYCAQCGIPIHSTFDSRCGNCRTQKPAFDTLRSMVIYDGPVQILMTSWKYHGHMPIRRTFAHLIKEHCPAYGSHYDMIIPVPIHTQKLMERGFNTSTLIAMTLSRHLKIPCHTHLLTKTNPTKPQTDLTRDDRLNNIKYSDFTINDPKNQLTEKRILLVDDVATTGTTLSACASALKKTGKVAHVDAFTIARTVTH